MKKIIRLTENDLHNIVNESVNRILNEIGDTAKGQYMLGRLQGRQSASGDRNNAMKTQNYALRQMTNKFGNRTPNNFQTYDAYDAANELGWYDEAQPELSKNDLNTNSSIANYKHNIRTNYLRGVSKY